MSSRLYTPRLNRGSHFGIICHRSIHPTGSFGTTILRSSRIDSGHSHGVDSRFRGNDGDAANTKREGNTKPNHRPAP